MRLDQISSVRTELKPQVPMNEGFIADNLKVFRVFFYLIWDGIKMRNLLKILE